MYDFDARSKIHIPFPKLAFQVPAYHCHVGNPFAMWIIPLVLIYGS